MTQYQEEAIILQQIMFKIQKVLETSERIEKKLENIDGKLAKLDGIEDKQQTGKMEVGILKNQEKNEQKGKITLEIDSDLSMVGNGKEGLLKGKKDGKELNLRFQGIEGEKREELMDSRETLIKALLITKYKLIKEADRGSREFRRYAITNKVRREVHTKLIKKTIRRSIPHKAKEIRLYYYWQDTG